MIGFFIAWPLLKRADHTELRFIKSSLIRKHASTVIDEGRLSAATSHAVTHTRNRMPGFLTQLSLSGFI